MSYHAPTQTITTDIEVKKSRFFVLGGPIQSIEDVRVLRAEFKEAHPKAGHHCWAYQLGAPGHSTQDSSDDGEPKGSAGKPMLTALNGLDVGDACVIVARYFGGVKLGVGGLVRAYSSAVKAWADDACFTEVQSQFSIRVRFPYTLAGPMEGLARQLRVAVADQRFDQRVEQTWVGLATEEEAVIAAIHERLHLGLELIPSK